MGRSAPGEPRRSCGTPGCRLTVAPFRAWRGSAGKVAQGRSPPATDPLVGYSRTAHVVESDRVATPATKPDAQAMAPGLGPASRLALLPLYALLVFSAARLAENGGQAVRSPYSKDYG